MVLHDGMHIDQHRRVLTGAVAVSLARNQGDEHPSTKDVMTTYEHLSNSLPMSGEGGGEAAAASS